MINFKVFQSVSFLVYLRNPSSGLRWLKAGSCDHAFPLLFLVVLARIVFHPGATLLLSELKGER